jgi:hypothetical protein
MRSRRGRRSEALGLLHAACPYLFLVASLLTSVFLAWNLPPFMGADELAHVERAFLGADGQLAGRRVTLPDGGEVAGGRIQWSLHRAYVPFDDIRFNPQEKADLDDYARAFPARWQGGRRVANFAGSAGYPPMFYAPASLGLAVGRALDWPIIQSLYLARLAQAGAACLVGFFALLLARGSRPYLYAVLLLPMATGLYSAVTADGLLIATTALAAGLVARARAEERAMTARELVGAAACLACVAMTKPPYMLLALPLLAVDAPRRWRYGATLGVVAAAVAWLLFSAATIQTPLMREGVVLDPAGQIAYLVGHPLAIVDVALNTLSANWSAYRMTVIGVLGWLDTPLPQFYYPLAWGVLVAALVFGAALGGEPEWRNLKWAAGLAALAAFGAIHAALYVTWSAVGAPRVEGVAGRYFLPLLCFLALLLEGRRPILPESGVAAWPKIAVTAAILAFPLFSLVLIERAVILRYYLD